MSFLLMIMTLFFLPGEGHELLQSGPMVGYADKREVMLWVQTTRSATVQIRCWDREKAKTAGIGKIAILSDPITTQKNDDFIAHILLGELEPGIRYDYDVLINNKAVTHTYPFTFQTQTLWEWRTDPPDFTVAFGSCLYIADSVYDRPGKPYASDFHIVTSMAAQKPDVMLWIGDNLYYREVDWYTRSGMLYRNRHTRSYKDLQPLLAASSNYAVWDDHDYGPNDSDRGFMQKDVSLEAFKLYWANPAYGTADTRGVFFTFRWNDVDFYMLDDRYHRSPNAMEDGPEKTLLGKEQLQWLKDNLLTSRAPFKIINCGGQVLNANTTYESYNFFKYERAELLAFIKKYKITGVVFLSGDIHHTELLKWTDPGFYTMYDFTSSPFTSGLHSGDTDFANPQLVPDTKVTDAHTFGMLRFSGKRNDRKLIMETYDANGILRWSFTLHENDLKPKK